MRLFAAAGLRLQRNQTWSDHVFRTQDVVEHLFVQQLLFAHQFQYAAAGFQGNAGDTGGVFVADVRVQGGDQADRVLDQFTAALFVGSDATMQCSRSMSMARCSRRIESKIL